MVVPTQLAAVAALLEVVLVRILGVVAVAVAVVDILVADTVVVVVEEAEEDAIRQILFFSECVVLILQILPSQSI